MCQTKAGLKSRDEPALPGTPESLHIGCELHSACRLFTAVACFMNLALSYAECVCASCDFSLLIVVLCFVVFVYACLPVYFLKRRERKSVEWVGGKVEEPVRGWGKGKQDQNLL